MRRLISILLAFAVLLSVAGYLIPCTLHCLNSGSGHGHGQTHTQEHADGEHNHDSGKECDGMCSTEHMSKKTSDQASASPMHQAQFMAQMLTATFSIDLDLVLVNPAETLDPTLAINALPIFIAPPVPPPKHVFLRT